MSSDSDVRTTSHDRHDPMLVAALAAGDLAGTDRDQAIALTRSCAECRTLHDDLIALARATASVPPPITTRPRDFQLTPVDAARLRPSGWRRLFGSISAPRPRLTAQAGVAFTTLGLVGLLVGNVQFSFGSSAASPQAAGGAAHAPAAPDTAKEVVQGNPPDSGAGRTSGSEAALGAVASGAPAPQPASSDGYAMGVASSAPRTSYDQASPRIRGGAVGGADDSSTTASGPTQSAQGNESSGSTLALTEPSRPLNLVFIAAVAIGLILLVGSRIARRRGA